VLEGGVKFGYLVQGVGLLHDLIRGLNPNIRHS
jgi:hypothetical protein